MHVGHPEGAEYVGLGPRVDGPDFDFAGRRAHALDMALILMMSPPRTGEVKLNCPNSFVTKFALGKASEAAL